MINILELLAHFCAIRADVQEPYFHKKIQTRVLVFKIVKLEMSQIVSHITPTLRWSIHLSAQFPHYQLWKNPVTARPSLVRCPPSVVDQSSFNCPTSYHTFLNWHQVSIKGKAVFVFDDIFFGDKNCIFLLRSRTGTTQQKLHLTRIARRDHIEEVWTASELGLSARRRIATAGSPILR